MDYQYLYWLETTDRLFKIDFKELKRLYPNVEKLWIYLFQKGLLILGNIRDKNLAILKMIFLILNGLFQ